MKQITVTFEEIRPGEHIVTGLEPGYVLVPARIYHNVRRSSRAGCFWPFCIEHRLTKYDQPDWDRVAIEVKLIPLCA